MRALVVDANAGIHAKQVSTDQPGVHRVAVLDRVAAAGLVLTLTAKVLGEQNKGSVRTHHERWQAAGQLRVETVSVNEVRAVRNRVGNARPIPNDPDVALIALALRLSGVLYTHDRAAAGWAKRCGVIVVDVVDLAAWAVHRGLAAPEQVEAGHVGIDGRDGLPKPDDWAGSIAATHAARSGRERLLAFLDAWIMP